MGNSLSFRSEGTHEAEIVQSPSTKDEAKAAGGYSHWPNKTMYDITRKRICRLILWKEEKRKSHIGYAVSDKIKIIDLG